MLGLPLLLHIHSITDNRWDGGGGRLSGGASVRGCFCPGGLLSVYPLGHIFSADSVGLTSFKFS